MTQKPSMTSSIPLPSVRIGTRVVLPAVIVFSAIAILAWSSWRAWAPLTTVRAVPVVIRAAGGSTSMAMNSLMSDAVLSKNEALNSGQMNSVQTSAPRGAVVQAPGWVEPSPFPIAASALISGVVREVLVLEGDHVEKDQVVARLINDQAKIALRRSEAEVKIKSAELGMLQDELGRKQKLVAGGGVSEGEVARLAIKILGAKAVVEQAAAAHEEAELTLARTEVRAPVAGVVMTRLAAPGSLVGMDASTTAVVELFDPKNLQVRTDVPLADAGRLRVGQQAQVQFDSLPGQAVCCDLYSKRISPRTHCKQKCCWKIHRMVWCPTCWRAFVFSLTARPRQARRKSRAPQIILPPSHWKKARCKMRMAAQCWPTALA